MCRASRKPSDNFWLRFASVMAGAAECHKIVQGVGFGNGPWDDVVNVKFPALARQSRLMFAARLAAVAVTGPRKISLQMPVRPSPVVSRRAALPQGAGRSTFRPRAGGNIAGMSAEAARLTVEALKRYPAMVAVLGCRLHPAPSGLVVARHVAEPASVGVIGKSLKWFSTAFTGFDDPRPWLGWLARPGAIPPAPVARECRSAFWTCFFHSQTVSESDRVFKNFDIACRRVDEAARQPDMLIPATMPKPTQGGLDL